MSFLSRMTNVFRHRTVDRDIDEELQSHLADAYAAGRDAAEVKRAFGSQLRAREEVRDAIVARRLESLLADSRFAFRQLRRSKSVAAAAILSLGLGMGACVGSFRLIDALLLRPLPVDDPGNLYVLGVESRDDNGETVVQESFNYPGFRLLRDAVRDHGMMLAISFAERINLTYGSEAELERVYRQHVSGAMFAEFGLRPVVGRLFTESDDVTPGAHPYAVLSYDYWQRRFGGDSTVVGRTFRSGTVLYEVIGVAPEGFTGTAPGTFVDVFMPATMYTAEALQSPNWQWFRPWVHVRSGSSVEVVREKLRAAMRVHRAERVKGLPAGALTQRDLEEFLGAPIRLSPAGTGVSGLQQIYGRSLLIVGLVAAMVLLIACVNVANLMTAQAAARAREMALRVSIGAGRARLIQLVLVQSAWIAVAASAVGILFAWWAAPMTVGMIDAVDAPVRLDLSTHGGVIAFAGILTLLVTMLFGVAPALRASWVRPASALTGGDDPYSRRRLMSGLIAAQVAFCVAVQLVAGLFVSSFDRLVDQPLGFSSARVITLSAYALEPQHPQAWHQVADHLRSLPGVENAAVSTFALMSGGGFSLDVRANGRASEGIRPPWFLGVSPEWFDTMKVPVLEGRPFQASDASPSIAIVNQTFARRFFDGRSPVGQTLERMQEGTRVPAQIIGVVADARYTGLRGAIPATVYVPFGTLFNGGPPENRATFNVRTENANPALLSALFRQEVPRAGAAFRVSNIRTQDELVRSQTTRERVLATLSIFFAVVALLLAGVGLFGVLNYAVTQRRRELGIRIALGAGAREIASRVTTALAATIAVGAGAGLALGISAERFIATLLFGVKATDPRMVAWATLTIVGAAALAALPAVLRAVWINPSTLLRPE